MGLKYNRVQGLPDNAGEYFGRSAKLQVTLPEGAQLSQAAQTGGWTYVPGTNNTQVEVTKESTQLQRHRGHCGAGTVTYPLRIEFPGLPIDENGAPKIYTATANALVDPDTTAYNAGSDFFTNAFGKNVF